MLDSSHTFALAHSGNLIKVMDHQSDALDADLEYSRSIMRAVEEREKRVDWDQLKRKALERTHSECPVCLREMEPKECDITSCGHMFHTTCIDSWLKFCETQDKQPTCPVCRAIFQHQAMVEKKETEEKPSEKYVTIEEFEKFKEDILNGKQFARKQKWNGNERNK